MSSSLTWGVPAVAPPVPPEFDLADGLQPIVDAFVGGGGIIELPRGTYYADPGSPSTPLNIPASAGGLLIRGEREDDTIIASPVLIGGSKVGLERLRVSPNGTDYGVKLYNGGSPFIARCWMREVWIGAVDKNAAIAGQGPRDGLVFDGAGVFLAEKCTLAFNQRHGLLADSTGFEPNTTIKMDMCSFVQNGFGPLGAGVGYGAKVMQSCNLFELNGGNSEGNKSGEVYIEEITNLRLRDFFMETASTASFQNMLHIVNCTCGIVDNCFFSNTAGVNVTRGFFVQTSQGIRVISPRLSGWLGNVGVGRIGEGSAQCSCEYPVIVPDNTVGAGGVGYIEDYSR